MSPILFLKQCLSEVMMEPVQEAKLRCAICGGNAYGKQWWNQDRGRGICSACAIKIKTSGQEDIRQSYGKEGIHYFVKECVLEVLKENLCEGGFDPQSQAGPNAPMENPYPEWNSKMAKMEEETVTPEDSNDAKYYFNQLPDDREKTIIRLRMQGYRFDDISIKFGITSSRVRAIYAKALKKLHALSQRDSEGKPADPSKFLVPHPSLQKESDPHGREAQTAGAGQFDPRTFGVQELKKSLSEINLKPLFATLLIGYAGSKSGLISHFQHTPEGQKIVQSATKLWNSVPVAQQTTDTAKKIWSKVMTPTHISDPTKALPSEKDMGAYDLAKKYSDRDDDITNKTTGFVRKYLPPEKS